MTPPLSAVSPSPCLGPGERIAHGQQQEDGQGQDADSPDDEQQVRVADEELVDRLEDASHEEVVNGPEETGHHSEYGLGHCGFYMHYVEGALVVCDVRLVVSCEELSV